MPPLPSCHWWALEQGTETYLLSTDSQAVICKDKYFTVSNKGTFIFKLMQTWGQSGKHHTHTCDIVTVELWHGNATRHATWLLILSCINWANFLMAYTICSNKLIVWFQTQHRKVEASALFIKLDHKHIYSWIFHTNVYTRNLAFMNILEIWEKKNFHVLLMLLSVCRFTNSRTINVKLM